MSDLSQILSIAGSGMRAQGARLRHVSENIANADTPGYRRKLISFENAVHQTGVAGTVKTGPVSLSQGDLKQVYDPSHPMANEDGYFNGSNVDLMIEVADAREAQRSYQANLQMFDQARRMSTSLLDLLKR